MTLREAIAAAQHGRCCVTPSDTSLEKALHRGLQSGTITRVHRGLYHDTAYWSNLGRLDQVRHIVRSLAAKHEDWVFCGPTAAIMHGLDVSYRLATPIHIVAEPGAHQRRGKAGKALARIAMAHPDVETVDGVKVTCLLRTLFDCAAQYALRYALGPIDSALRKGKVDKETLTAYPRVVKYAKQRAKVERAFALADARSENAGESEARGTLHAIGRPAHDIQVSFPCLDEPGKTHRVDFLWKRSDGTVILGEFDGTAKYVDPQMTAYQSIRDVVADERDRQRCLERQGKPMVRMFYRELDRMYDLQRKLDKAGVPGESGKDGLGERHE